MLGPEARLALVWDARSSRFPAGARCRCGEARAFVFVEASEPIRCYQCARVADGHSMFEEHHLGGRPSPYAPFEIPANLHRILTDLQDAYWRGRVPPGSLEAVAFDLVAFIAATSRRLFEVGAAL